MRTFFAIFCTVAAFALATPVFATENPCGNHGNHCCTDDGGESYDSVETTCSSFCESTASAVATAVSECSASCAITLADTVANAVSVSTANCAQTCSVPLCLKWKIRRNSDGQPVSRTCKKTAEQPIQ